MKQIFFYIKHHFCEDFEWKTYGMVALFLTISIYFNYKFDFEDSIIDSYARSPLHMLFFFLFYGFAFFGTILILTFTKKVAVFRNRKFWLMSLFGLAIMAIDAGFPYIQVLTGYFPEALSYLAYKVIKNIFGFFSIFLPLLFFKKLVDKNNGFYGFVKQPDYKPYLVLLCLMIPVIYWASLQPDFLKSYPSYKSNMAYQYLKVPEWVTAGVFEIAYALDFVNVELLFRGL